ncbi:MAG TPA: lipoyl domain-containing protein [Acidisoma sp.]|jgi:pyruvate/2-oxoglutarate dehydrogenase complex dihydrolipoamide acyltransferase (E2) component|uniref:lipoyl domain-containing protein n=1 Tax=Acidisoma sp. TaxID=1872115 RepID=UPI002CA700CF|nr:lipoyl domain-containing protein [Acidisoma sp.]HTI01912.1 lipoyl domain-containing protein [Acidisoma sp.]
MGMIYRLSVPAAVPGVEEVRVLEWHGEAGTVFAPGDLIVELETHKAVVEARAGQAGVLREIKSAAGDWCGIGSALAMFSDTADEALPDGPDGAPDLVIEFAII